MFDISVENPYIYVDSIGDTYSFSIFTDRTGKRHFNITITYANIKKTESIFGYLVRGHGFALPLDGETIMWNAYDNVPNTGPRWRCMSEDAIKMADKIFKLKAFL